MTAADDSAKKGNAGLGTECTHAQNCALFPLFRLESTNAVWRTFYCYGNFKSCARWKVAAEGKPMPLTLLPNGKWLDQGKGSH